MNTGDLTLRVGRMLSPTTQYHEVSITIEDGWITDITQFEDAISDPDMRIDDGIAVPGFIDTHIHGHHGYDVMDGEPTTFSGLAESVVSHGVTTLYPTTMSAQRGALLDVARAFSEVSFEDHTGARLEGLHLEGPYLSSGEESGAQDAATLRDPDLEEFKSLYTAADEQISRITLAPELTDATRLIQYANEHEITVAAGHSEIEYEDVVEVFENGVSHITHLFNGMPSFHHREPGLIGASLTRDDVSVEVIADLYHLHPVAIEVALRTKGIDNTTLVTDAIPPTGCSDGKYRFGGQDIVIEDGVSRVEGSGRLAGSTLTMESAIENITTSLGLDLPEAVALATTSPALSQSLSDRGQLSEGYRGDITILSESLDVLATVVNGNVVYRSNHPSQRRPIQESTQ